MQKGGIYIYEQMLSEHKRLEQQIRLLQTKINDLPAGKLICSHYKGRCKWYQSDGHKKRYIPKNDLELAKQLALKKYLLFQMEDLLTEKRAVQSYLAHHCAAPGKAELLLSKDMEYQSLLSGQFTPLSQELTDWMNAPYPQNPAYPEQLVHKSISGRFVRSKSEAMIDMFLHLHKIPSRYECALQLGESTVFPDFTIRHPKTGLICYWEHFGMMDHAVYSQKAFAKQQLYTIYGLVPSIQLITTYETKDTPLSTELVEKIIQHYFL